MVQANCQPTNHAVFLSEIIIELAKPAKEHVTNVDSGIQT